MRRYTQKTALVTLSDINITPLLDLAFVLLIIFMITTPLMEQGLQLQLPKGQVADHAPEKRDLKTVEVDAQGRYYIDTQPISLEELQSNLAKAFSDNPNLVLVLRGDIQVAYEHIYIVIDKARQLGIQNYYLANEISP